MKVLVTGGSGMIGSKFVSDLAKEGNDVSYTYLTREPSVKEGTPVKLDVSERESMFSMFHKFKPEITIHCSALTNVDLCETDKKMADSVNVEGTRNVVDACKEMNSKIIYISTSFVFDGTKKVYYEDDKPNPVNHYGVTKLKGEELTKKSGQPSIILRTDHPYRWSLAHVHKNNIMKLIDLFERGERMREAMDWFNTPTLVDNISEVVTKLIKSWDNDIFHVVGPDFISRYDLAMKVAEAIDGNKDLVEKIKSSGFKLVAKRPYVNLNNTKVQKKTGVKMLGVDEGIRLILKQRGKQK